MLRVGSFSLTAALSIGALFSLSFANSAEPLLEAEGYKTQRIFGWTVLVSDALRDAHPEETAIATRALEKQCRKVIEVVPATILPHLQSVPLWMSLPVPGRRPRAEFHPSAEWLFRNDMDPAKAKGIEFSNILIFEKEIVRMPMLLMHELAHAYHNLILGYDHEGIDRLYRRAKESGDYDQVARKNRQPQKAYAITNRMEYFAETTEAYLGENDFFPFNRIELKEHDPLMHALLEGIWGPRERL